jgi:hypothetical protein
MYSTFTEYANDMLSPEQRETRQFLRPALQSADRVHGGFRLEEDGCLIVGSNLSDLLFEVLARMDTVDTAGSAPAGR